MQLRILSLAIIQFFLVSTLSFELSALAPKSNIPNQEQVAKAAKVLAEAPVATPVGALGAVENKDDKKEDAAKADKDAKDAKPDVKPDASPKEKGGFFSRLFKRNKAGDKDAKDVKPDANTKKEEGGFFSRFFKRNKTGDKDAKDVKPDATQKTDSNTQQVSWFQRHKTKVFVTSALTIVGVLFLVLAVVSISETLTVVGLVIGFLALGFTALYLLYSLWNWLGHKHKKVRFGITITLALALAGFGVAGLLTPVVSVAVGAVLLIVAVLLLIYSYFIHPFGHKDDKSDAGSEPEDNENDEFEKGSKPNDGEELIVGDDNVDPTSEDNDKDAFLKEFQALQSRWNRALQSMQRNFGSENYQEVVAAYNKDFSQIGVDLDPYAQPEYVEQHSTLSKIAADAGDLRGQAQAKLDELDKLKETNKDKPAVGQQGAVRQGSAPIDDNQLDNIDRDVDDKPELKKPEDVRKGSAPVEDSSPFEQNFTTSASKGDTSLGVFKPTENNSKSTTGIIPAAQQGRLPSLFNDNRYLHLFGGTVYNPVSPDEILKDQHSQLVSSQGAWPVNPTYTSLLADLNSYNLLPNEGDGYAPLIYPDELGFVGSNTSFVPVTASFAKQPAPQSRPLAQKLADYQLPSSVSGMLSRPETFVPVVNASLERSCPFGKMSHYYRAFNLP